MLGGSGSIVSGIGTIVTSITGGGAITVSSGGTLVLGGGAIVVEGVIAGTAQVTYGGVVLEASAKNFGNDLNKLREASKSDGDFKINKKTGRVGSLSTKGEANSVTELYDNNGKLLQKHYYDSNGKVYKDIDFSHGNSDGTHTFPHEHNWDWSKKNPRQ